MTPPTEPDTVVVLGCIAFGLLCLLFSAGCAGWILCRRSLLRKMQRVDMINAAGEHREVLLLEEQC